MPTDNNFINNIKITKYKIFQDFYADDFKRINLIGGYNNVGKTAFLEACYINSKASTIKDFIGVITSVEYMRQNINMLTKCSSQGGLTNKDLISCN